MKRITILSFLILAAQVISAQNLADLFQKHKNSVVTIYVAEEVSTGTGDPRTFTSSMGLGSGVLIDNDMVLTASHVVANAEDIMVQFYDGQAIGAETFRVSRVADVAVIKLNKAPKDPHPAKLANSDMVRVGESVFVIGAPMGLPYSLSSGVISGRHAENKLTGDGKQLEFLQTDAAINTGNSGGPMYNFKGEVVGIVSSILTRSGGFEGIGFAATTNICKDLLTAPSSRYFGIEIVVLPYEFARILNVPQESGWLIQHVTKDSPAGNIGLKGGFRSVTVNEQEFLLGGDIILSVDDIKITGEETASRIYEYMDGISSNHKYHITVLRAGETMDFYWIKSGK